MTEQPKDGDWVSQAVGYLESAVNLVRDRAVSPIIAAVRWIVFGILAGIVVVAVMILVAITIVRLLFLLPGHRAWLAHLITSLLFLGAGAIAMRRRHTKVTAS